MSFFGRRSGSKATDPEEAFWQWFQANSDGLRKVVNGQEPICRQLVAQMKRVDKAIVYAFGPEVDGRREFVVSADGIKSAFPAVQKLVAAAPPPPGWKVIAFRPPVGFDGTVDFGGHQISADDIRFTAQLNGDLVDLKLYMKPPAQNTDPNMLYRIAFIFLDYGLGEYAVETKLGSIEVQPLPEDPAFASLKPLRQLPEMLEMMGK